jgi:hypothetical protein
MAFGLKNCNSGDHGRYYQDSRHGARQHVLHDVLRRSRQLIARDEDPHLFFEGGMATQKLGALDCRACMLVS